MLTFGPVRITPTTDDHVEAFWRILRERPIFWLDKQRIETWADFQDWWRRIAKSSLTGIDQKEERVIGGGFLDQIYEPNYATIHIFTEKRYLNPRLMAGVMRTGLPWFFREHNIEKIMGIFPDWHRATLRMAKRCGFREDGVLRHHQKVNGQWVNYVMVSILRGEVNGLSRLGR